MYGGRRPGGFVLANPDNSDDEDSSSRASSASAPASAASSRRGRARSDYNRMVRIQQNIQGLRSPASNANFSSAPGPSSAGSSSSSSQPTTSPSRPRNRVPHSPAYTPPPYPGAPPYFTPPDSTATTPVPGPLSASSSSVLSTPIPSTSTSGSSAWPTIDSSPGAADRDDPFSVVHHRGGSSGTEVSPVSQVSYKSLGLEDATERVWVQVTSDGENFHSVDITGLQGAERIKERIFNSLNIPPFYHPAHSLYRTELGTTPAEAIRRGQVLDKDLVLQCHQYGDAKATLKYFVELKAPPRQVSGPLLSPPNSDRPTLNVTVNGVHGNPAHRRVSPSRSSPIEQPLPPHPPASAPPPPPPPQPSLMPPHHRPPGSYTPTSDASRTPTPQPPPIPSRDPSRDGRPAPMFAFDPNGMPAVGGGPPPPIPLHGRSFSEAMPSPSSGVRRPSVPLGAAHQHPPLHALDPELYAAPTSTSTSPSPPYPTGAPPPVRPQRPRRQESSDYLHGTRPPVSGAAGPTAQRDREYNSPQVAHPRSPSPGTMARHAGGDPYGQPPAVYARERERERQPSYDPRNRPPVNTAAPSRPPPPASTRPVFSPTSPAVSSLSRIPSLGPAKSIPNLRAVYSTPSGPTSNLLPIGPSPQRYNPPSAPPPAPPPRRAYAPPLQPVSPLQPRRPFNDYAASSDTTNQRDPRAGGITRQHAMRVPADRVHGGRPMHQRRASGSGGSGSMRRGEEEAYGGLAADNGNGSGGEASPAPSPTTPAEGTDGEMDALGNGFQHVLRFLEAGDVDDGVESASGTLMPPTATLIPKARPKSPPQRLAPQPPPPPRNEDEDEEDDDDDGYGTIWLRPPAPAAPSTPSLKPYVPPIQTQTQPPKPPRTAFTDLDLAERPPAEDVYDRLEEFFPDHDLDKPVIDAASSVGGGSPTGGVHAPAGNGNANPAAGGGGGANKYKHKKSIRLVAAAARIKLSGGGGKEDAKASMARKRSTKLWGSRVEEVTPAQELQTPSEPDSPAGLGPPRTVFKWIKGDMIGKGTYGRVYHALNATTGDMIAVKQVELPKTEADRQDSRQTAVVEAIKSESDTLKDLDHPNIVQYLGCEETEDYFNIFLEYVPGGSLGRMLKRCGKFDENVIKNITQQILDGLSYLHEMGIVHRDLKADNILIDHHCVCKISDFGTSKRSEDAYSNQAATLMQGTIPWMAPEVLLKQGEGYSAKADIWSLGCVFLEMWAGERPWSQQEMYQVMFSVANLRQAPPVPDNVQIPPDADAFRLRCCAINPDDRPTAAALRRDPYLRLPDNWVFTTFN